MLGIGRRLVPGKTESLILGSCVLLGAFRRIEDRVAKRVDVSTLLTILLLILLEFTGIISSDVVLDKSDLGGLSAKHDDRVDRCSCLLIWFKMTMEMVSSSLKTRVEYSQDATVILRDGNRELGSDATTMLTLFRRCLFCMHALDGLCFPRWPEFGNMQRQQARGMPVTFCNRPLAQPITMFKRQPLTAVSSVRPRCPVSLRAQSVRSYSDINWANRQRGQEKGSNTMRMLDCLSPASTARANPI